MFSKPLNARSQNTRQGFATAAARIFLKLLSMGGRWSLTARLGCQCANMLLASGDRQEGKNGSCRHAHLTVWLRFGSSRCSAALICFDVTNAQVRRRQQLETVQVRPSARELSEHDFSAREETILNGIGKINQCISTIQSRQFGRLQFIFYLWIRHGGGLGS